jgi:hypothetical protein
MTGRILDSQNAILPLDLPPSLDRGPVQRRARRAFVATGLIVMTTPQIAEWTHPRGGTATQPGNQGPASTLVGAD